MPWKSLFLCNRDPGQIEVTPAPSAIITAPQGPQACPSLWEPGPEARTGDQDTVAHSEDDTKVNDQVLHEFNPVDDPWFTGHGGDSASVNLITGGLPDETMAVPCVMGRPGHG